MGNKPVSTYLAILRSIEPSRLNVNKIYRQTGLSFKQAVTQAIKELEKDGLVTRIKNKTHTQMEYIQLTELGRELADIAMSFEQYKKSLVELVNKESEQFDIPKSINQDSLKSMLKNRGWSEEEIFWYEESESGVSYVMFTCDGDIIDILLKRYALRLYKFNISTIARAIMDSVLIDATRLRLSYVLENIEYYRSKGIQPYTEIADQELSNIAGITYSFPRVIYEQVKNALISYLLLLKPPKELIIDKIQKVKEKMESAEEYTREQAKEERRWYVGHFRCLLDAYQEYLTKLT
jgi:DNA-binding HxlR family transcriptional regulator